jgi:hypothetical protein
MFPLLPEAVLLESDQNLEIHTFQLPSNNLNLWGTEIWCKWLGWMHLSLPNTTQPMYIQQLTEEILPPIQTFMSICK